MHRRRRPFSVVARDDFFFFPCLEPPLLGVLCHVDIVAEPLMERHDAKTSSSGAKKAKIFFGARCRARQLPRPPPAPLRRRPGGTNTQQVFAQACIQQTETRGQAATPTTAGGELELTHVLRAPQPAGKKMQRDTTATPLGP